MNELQSAYLAGVFDGEGSTGITINYNATGHCSVQAYVGITGADENFIKKIHEMIGFGNVTKTEKRSDLEFSNLPIFYWRTSKKANVELFFKKTGKYLIEKKEHSELILEFLEEKKRINGLRHPKGLKGTLKMPLNDKVKRIINRFIDLNKKGIKRKRFT